MTLSNNWILDISVVDNVTVDIFTADFLILRHYFGVLLLYCSMKIVKTEKDMLNTAKHKEAQSNILVTL